MAERTDELLDFALFALDHATASVIASGGPLVPFAMTVVDGDTNLYRFAGDLTEGQARAREHVRSASGRSLAAVAWDGYLTAQGQRSDAVFVEASRAGASNSVLMAQRYRKKRLSGGLERVGNPAIVEDGLPPLW